MKKLKKKKEKLIIRILEFIISLIGTNHNPEQCEKETRIRAYIYSVTLSEITITGEITMIEIREGQVGTGQIGLKTAGGHTAAIEPGSATITSSDDSVVSVFLDPNDETKFHYKGLDGSANESVVVEWRADGKRGEGVRDVVAAGTIICSQGDVVAAEMTFNPPTDEEGTPAATGSADGGASEAPAESEPETGGETTGGQGEEPATESPEEKAADLIDGGGDLTKEPDQATLDQIDKTLDEGSRERPELGGM